MDQTIAINCGHIELEGQLCVPKDAIGIVLFAHGSGSSRFSPRNNFVANLLQQSKIATLLIDLLSKEEDVDYAMRFDIPLLTKRLLSVANWLQNHKETKDLPLCLFGASTGAAAALDVAAELGDRIAAVVSRGGRPDLSMALLPKVVAPTLLIVGQNDPDVIKLNEQAYQRLRCPKSLSIIPRASHLFEEPGTLDEVARESLEWFLTNLEQKSPLI